MQLKAPEKDDFTLDSRLASDSLRLELILNDGRPAERALRPTKYFTLPEEHAGGGQHQLVRTVRAVSHQDGAVTEVALLPQSPQLLHQLAAVVG